MSYTCCEAKDIDTPYQPGQAMTVHWIVRVENADAESAPRVELNARLTGRYATVADVKAAAPDTSASENVTFAAEPVRPSGTAEERPVSTILIASDAEPGYYNLVFSVTQDGATVSGSSIVRVVARA